MYCSLFITFMVLYSSCHEERKKVNLVAWETFYVPKCNEGLNIIKGYRNWNFIFVGKLLCNWWCIRILYGLNGCMVFHTSDDNAN
ncbi:hypothetical protein H5410_062871 [Solanum commersonii]|uniref:Uncharacterized protein n=1 Tax=Solanum commersonii TaxID=4109 RepID=A0A9J5WBT9_SOLCO|nr:hypothetical protein H5410_062871 [Solanum commersonii]